MHFVEIGADEDHVHFLVQSVPAISPKVKSITAREIFKIHPEVGEFLWGGKFWTSRYYANTVGLYAGADVIKITLENKEEIINKFILCNQRCLRV